MTATSTSSASTPRRRRARSTSRPAATSPSTADCCSTSSRPRTAATRRGSTSSPSASSSSPAASPPTVRPATRPPPTSPPRTARRARPTRPPDHHRGPAPPHRPRARRLPRVNAMSTTTSSRHETATRFLAALAGSADDRELLELRYRLDDGLRLGQVFERPTRLRGLATRAVALGRRTDVYAGCAPRTRRHGGRERAFVLWADCDGEHAIEALRSFEPAPSIVIASGTGNNCHAYWPLTEPLPRDEIERANRRLAHALAADPASADAARILRVPGTLSHKHDPPSPVDALRLDPDRRIHAGDVVAGLPDPPAPARTPFTPAPAQVCGHDPLLAIAPDVYVRRLLGVEVPRHRKVRCPFHEDRHASLHVYEKAERGWYCFGACRRGGTIYDLAAPLYGYSARGEDFLRLRTELCRMFALETA